MGVKAGVNELIIEKHNTSHMPRGNLSRFFLGNKNLRNIAGKFGTESKKRSLINSLLLKWDTKKTTYERRR